MLNRRIIKVIPILTVGIVLCLMAVSTAYADTGNESAEGKEKIVIGTEVDLLPYLSGGYYLSEVTGFQHFQVRLVNATTLIPEFVTPAGFDSWKLNATTIIIDYFPDEDRKGLWLAIGYEYWNSRIKVKETNENGSFSQNILTIGSGYVYRLSDHWYIDPWAALHLNLGDKTVTIGSKNLDLPDCMLEASIKVGYNF